MRSHGRGSLSAAMRKREKIVERRITWVLESIYKEDFLDCSYGFRPKRNAHQALKKFNDLIMFQPVNHIVEYKSGSVRGIGVLTKE